MSPEAEPYVLLSRDILLFFLVVLVVRVRVAWRRNSYDERRGFTELPERAEAPTLRALRGGRCVSTGALLFMVVSRSAVLGLAAWSFRRILRSPARPDPDAEERA